MNDDVQARLRALPKVDDVLRRADVAEVDAPRWAVVEAVRREIDERRRAILAGGGDGVELAADAIARRARDLVSWSLRHVINATGVVLHTNLGRAPLSERAIERVVEVARGYSNLEYDVGGRQRGSRHDHLADLLRAACGGEAALVVNNNAAAVLLCLAATAAGREVIVSRGELIEIGGSFRIPDVMRASGARLVEVGTTNKTHARDYERAIGAETALLLKVHRSNFAVVGFTKEVDADELVAIGAARGVPVMIDLGSGTMIDPASFEGAGLPSEPTVGAAVRSGAALVTFSGDKLLGGPQAGVIVGKADAVARAKSHPLMRAVRPDKMTIAALEGTLAAYRDGRARVDVPALRMLSLAAEQLRERAERLAAMIGDGGRVVEIRSAVGGGALPLAEPVSYAIAIGIAGRSAEEIDARLRAADPPVVGRIVDDRLVLDVRTIADAEWTDVVAAVAAARARG